MSTLALDIGTYSIKALAAKAGKSPKIERAVEVFNSVGVAIPTDDATMEKLGTLVETVIHDSDLPRSDVRLALPETVVSTKVISIPPLSDAELASAIGWQAEQHIPIPPEELALEYQVLYRPPKNEKAQMRVLLVGARKQVINRFIQMFNAIGIEPTLLETQAISVMRSLGFTAEDPSTLVVHIGAQSMQIVMVHQTEIAFVLSHMNGGQLLTRSLEQTVGLDAEQAEQYKRTYGLQADQFQGKVREALMPTVTTLTAEIRKAAQFFSNKYPKAAVQRVVLSGGTSLLPGFVQHVTSQVGVEVLVAAPFAVAQGEIPNTINRPGMSAALGLLLREM